MSEVFNHCQARRLAASSIGINESLPASPQELVAALGWVSPSGHIKLSVVFLICPSRDIGLRYTYSSLRLRLRERDSCSELIRSDGMWNLCHTLRECLGVSRKQTPYTTSSISNTIGSGIIYTTVLMSELEVAAPLRMDESTFAEEAFSISNCVMSSISNSNVLK